MGRGGRVAPLRALATVLKRCQRCGGGFELTRDDLRNPIQRLYCSTGCASSAANARRRQRITAKRREEAPWVDCRCCGEFRYGGPLRGTPTDDTDPLNLCGLCLGVVLRTCLAKSRYPHEDAVLAAGFWDHKARRPLRPYQCLFCQSWHRTSRAEPLTWEFEVAQVALVATLAGARWVPVRDFHPDYREGNLT